MKPFLQFHNIFYPGQRSEVYINIAGVLAQIWNSFLPKLIETARKLAELGFTYENGKVIFKPPKKGGEK